MRTIVLTWETRRSIIAALRAKGLPYMLEHADSLERQLGQHAPDAQMVSFDPSDDVYLSSFRWARVERDIPLPQVERYRATAIDREPSRTATSG